MEEMLTLQFSGIPDYVFITSFCVFSILIVGVFFLRKNIGTIRKLVLGMLLAEYVFLMFCSTVLCRTPHPERKRLELMPFWNYQQICTMDSANNLWEVVLNILLYIPIGFLLVACFNRLHGLRKYLIVVIISMMFSILTETIQYFFHRGLCETDDVIHNTIGCLLGIGLYGFVVNCFRRINN